MDAKYKGFTILLIMNSNVIYLIIAINACESY